MEISGIVNKGLGVCKKNHGYASANIMSDLSTGVYFGSTKYGACIIVVESPPTTEIHILYFNENLYNKTLYVENIERVPKRLTYILNLINQQGE